MKDRTFNKMACESLTTADRQELLRLARSAADACLRGLSPQAPNFETHPRLKTKGACFVTFKRRAAFPGTNGLRGCMGSFRASDAIGLAVQKMAQAAVTKDPRFASHPVSLEELQELRIDISILQPRRLLKDPLAFALGEEGIEVEGRGPFSGQRGVYLPQVATDHGLTREQLLSSCCSVKANLPEKAWQDPNCCEVFAFKAEMIEES